MRSFFEELNEIIEVENAIGSAEAWPKPNDYDSWKECWEARSRKKASSCFLCQDKDDLVGAHVLKSCDRKNANTHVYLTILCKRCNNLNDTFEIKESDLIDVTDVCPFSDIIDNYK